MGIAWFWQHAPVLPHRRQIYVEGAPIQNLPGRMRYIISDTGISYLLRLILSMAKSHLTIFNNLLQPTIF